MELPERKNYEKFVQDDETGELVKVHDARGAEIPDPVPMAPPIGYQRPLSMFDQMRAQIRAEHERLRNLELEQLSETREEANDFEVEEDIENMPSLYEEKFDPVDFEVRNRLRQEEFRANVEKRYNEVAPQPQELLDGRSLEDERGGEASRGTGVRKSVAKSEGDGKPVQKSRDKRDVPERDREVSGSDE